MQPTIDWQIANVKSIKPETAKAKSFTFALPKFIPHKAGQHYDLRLTAADGYQTQRSYSIASEPERTGEIDITVERIDEGEVSTYLHDVLIPGDRLEVRGPIGGYFVWEAASAAKSLLLIAGGSGVVPLMSMLRHRAAQKSKVPASLLYSSRTPEDVIYRDELDQLQALNDGLEVIHTFTRSQPPDWNGYARRIDTDMLKEMAKPLKSPQVFICGPTLLVEAAANGLVQIGVHTKNIRTERFGPTS